jgi:hypothetical protein
MDPVHLPTEEEVRRAAREGEDAVVSLVNNLIQVIAVFAERVQALEDQIAKNAATVASRPPAMAPAEETQKSAAQKRQE